MYWLVLLRVWSAVPSAKLRCRCCRAQSTYSVVTVGLRVLLGQA